MKVEYIVGKWLVANIVKVKQILVCVLLLGGLAYVMNSALVSAEVEWLDRGIVIVEDDVILQSQFDQQLKTIEDNIKNRPTGTRRPPQDMIEKQALENLILESIQLQMADRRGIRIDDEELNKAIEGIARQNNMTVAEFKMALQAEGVNYLDARERIRREMLVSRVQQWTLRNRIAVSEQEVESYLNSEEGQKRLLTEYLVSHVLLVVPTGASVEELAAIEREAKKIAAELKQGASFVELSREAVRGSYAIRSNDLGWRKTIEIPSLFVKQVPGMKVGEVVGPIQSPSGFHFIQLAQKRGAAVHMVDEVLARHILLSPNEVRAEAETQQLAQSVFQRIKKGEDFAELAKQFSEDPGSAREGGELGWASYDKYVAEFSAVAKQLSIDEVSKPFKTQFGWHILQVLERRNEDRSMEYQHNQIRRLIFNRKYEEEKFNWLRKIREEAFVEILEQDTQPSTE